jgi:hypothetical protein
MSSLTPLTPSWIKPPTMASPHFGELSQRDISLLNAALKQTPGLVAQTVISIHFPNDRLVATQTGDDCGHPVIIPKGMPVSIVGRLRKQDTVNAVQQADVATAHGMTYPEMYQSDIPHKLLILQSPHIEGPFTIVEREVHWFAQLMAPLDKMSKDFIMLWATKP